MGTEQNQPSKSAPDAIRFWKRGRTIELNQVDPNTTLLDYLRSSQGESCGTKEGCAQGDCGACTVVLAELPSHHSPDQMTQSLIYHATNSCIRFLHQIDGCALWTVEDLADEKGLHPVQQALCDHHASQCGFCTPGFVMSLFALYQNKVLANQYLGLRKTSNQAPSIGLQAVSLEQVQQALSGNLCRCTGYRPILDAAQAMHRYPARAQDEAAISAQLKLFEDRRLDDSGEKSQGIFRPKTLQALLKLRHEKPSALMMAGATDMGLWITKQHRQFSQVIDLNGVHELKTIVCGPQWIEIGAAVRMTEALEAICHDRPQLQAFAQRFAGLPVRNSATLAGNIANGSPIGDSMPLLIALGAKLRLAGSQGQRELALENFYPEYRRTELGPNEIISHVLIPLPKAGELSRVYKVSKRFEDDISAVCLGIRLDLEEPSGKILDARLGVGGMAATPMRAMATEQALRGQSLQLATIEHARQVLMEEFTPMSDMRASDEYRNLVLGNLLTRLWHEIRSPQALSSLEQLPSAFAAMATPLD